MASDILELTGPPKLITSDGIERVMPMAQGDGVVCFWADADTNYIEQADGSFRVGGDKYVRAGIQFGYQSLRGDDARFLIDWLKDSAPVIVPRTKAPGDPNGVEELSFEVEVISEIPFNGTIADQERLEIEVELLQKDPSAVGASITGSVEVTTVPGEFNGTLVDFVMPVDLALIPLCSTLWDDLTETIGNLRVRDTVGDEMPFEVGNFDYLNRSGVVYVRLTLDELSNSRNAFNIVATSNIAQALPPPTASNGAHQVHTNRNTWHLEQAPPNLLLDSSVDGANLTPDAGILQVHGVSGLGLDFNEDEFATEEAQGAINFPAAAFVVEVWVKIKQFAAQTGETYAIVSIDKSEAGTSPLFIMERTTLGKWRVAVSNTLDVETEVITALDADKEWNQLVLAFYDDSGLTVDLLQNGFSISAIPFVGTRATAIGNIVVGAGFDAGSITKYAQALIDQVVLYDEFPVVQISNLQNWIRARYSAFRPDGQTLYATEAKTVKQLPEGWYSEDSSLDYFPLNMPVGKSAAHVGIWGDEVIIAGGGDGVGILNTVHIYNIRTNTWEAQLNMPATIAGGAYGVIDGKFYVAGGWNGAAESNATYCFNFQTRAWSTVANYPINMNGAASAVLDGKLYAGGGTTGFVPTSNWYVYDPVADTWTAIANAPAGRLWGAAVASNGTILYSGGETGGNTQPNTYQYIPSLDVWGTKANMPVSIEQHVMIDLNGIVYSLGGQLTSGDETTSTSSIFYYDPLDVWFNPFWNIPRARNFHNAVVIAPNVVMVLGGNDGGITYRQEVDIWYFEDGDCINTKEVRTPANLEPAHWYDENDADYAPAPIPGTPKYAAASEWIGGRLYHAGGWTEPGQVETSDFYIYDPIVNRWIQGPDLPIVHGSGPWCQLNGEFYVGGDEIVDVWRYNIELGIWLTVEDLPQVVTNGSGTAYDGKFYVSNGDLMYVYDPVTDDWTQLASGPGAMVSPTILEFRGLIYLMSGFPASGVVHCYNPATNSWATVASFPENTIGSVAFEWNDRMFMFTGNDDTAGPAFNNFYEYDPDLDSWAAVPTSLIPTPITETQNPAVSVYNDRLYFIGGFEGYTTGVNTNSNQVLTFTLQRL